MEEEAYQQSFDLSSKLRDMEEKQNLIRDRLILIGQTLIEEREKSFKEIQELKKSSTILKQENERMKQIIQGITELLEKTARKEELMMLQRQFDLFRK